MKHPSFTKLPVPFATFKKPKCFAIDPWMSWNAFYDFDICSLSSVHVRCMFSRPLTLASTCHHHVMPPSINKKQGWRRSPPKRWVSGSSFSSFSRGSHAKKQTFRSQRRTGWASNGERGMKGGGIEVPLSDTRWSWDLYVCKCLSVQGNDKT